MLSSLFTDEVLEVESTSSIVAPAGSCDPREVRASIPAIAFRRDNVIPSTCGSWLSQEASVERLVRWAPKVMTECSFHLLEAKIPLRFAQQRVSCTKASHVRAAPTRSETATARTFMAGSLDSRDHPNGGVVVTRDPDDGDVCVCDVVSKCWAGPEVSDHDESFAVVTVRYKLVTERQYDGTSATSRQSKGHTIKAPWCGTLLSG